MFKNQDIHGIFAYVLCNRVLVKICDQIEYRKIEED